MSSGGCSGTERGEEAVPEPILLETALGVDDPEHLLHAVADIEVPSIDEPVGEQDERRASGEFVPFGAVRMVGGDPERRIAVSARKAQSPSARTGGR